MPGISKTDAYITATLLSIVAFIEGALHAPNFLKNLRYGLHLRIAAGSLIYRKVGTVLCFILFLGIFTILFKVKKDFSHYHCIFIRLQIIIIIIKNTTRVFQQFYCPSLGIKSSRNNIKHQA